MRILITGVASGIGRATADYFLNKGHTVYGIDRQPTDPRENFHSFVADITDENSLLSVRQTLMDEGVILDAIINVAGIHKMASLVECDCSSMKKLVDVNLCGAVFVNRIFHRCLKETGRIVIVTSEVAGMDPMPFNGLYSVTKTALETYAQALRQELNLLGQSVVTVRPGAVATPLCADSVTATANLADTTALYQKHAKRFSSIAAKLMGKPIPPEALAKLLYKATTAKHPKYHYQKHRNPGLVLLNILPRRLQCAIIKWLLRI